MNSPTSEVNVRTTNTSKWGQSRIKTIICQMCVNISWSLVLLFLQFSSKNMLWHHVPFGRLHLLEEKKGRRSHPWMLRNFILVPHSWTWRPTRLETGERNTTHHKAWLPVSKKKTKKNQTRGHCWHCFSLLWCRGHFLHLDQTFHGDASLMV